MAMKAPKFWDEDNLTAKILSPLSGIYAGQTAKRAAAANTAYKPKTPVICVGNLVAGGAGKTPTSIALANLFAEKKKKVNFLSGGYGGEFEGQQKVDGEDWQQFGDEAVMLSRTATTWVGKDRGEAAKKAIRDKENKPDLFIMDDGFQNGTIGKDFSVLVVDSEYGFGNGRVIPAGPLREPIEDGLKRADCVILIGEKKAKLPEFDIPVFEAEIEISYPDFLEHEEIVAFCGIARPEKFYKSLRARGLNVVEEISFPDHHAYSEDDLKKVFATATEKGAVAVTTEKDAVKVPSNLQMLVQVVKAELKIKESAKLQKLIKSKVKI